MSATKDTNCASQNGTMSNFSKVKNIVFDFGGVLLNIDYDRTYKALSKILQVDFHPDNLPENVLKILNEFETGVANKETFIWNIQRLANKDVPQGKEIIDACNAMLIGWDTSIFDILLALRKKYKVYLLSNTNEIHLEWVNSDLEKNHDISDFDVRFFDKTFYSHLIGFRKPDVAVYNYVTLNAPIKPKETIFIDDILRNIQGAQSAGWKGYHHHPADDLGIVLREKLKLNF